MSGKYPQAVVDRDGFWTCTCGWLNTPECNSNLEGDVVECDECSEGHLLVKAVSERDTDLETEEF